MSAGTLDGKVNSSDIIVNSQTLASAAAFALVIGANQFASISTLLRLSLPANHGGFKLNWTVPLRLDNGAWPYAVIEDDWSVVDVGSNEGPRFITCLAINDPTRTDAAIIIPAGGAARTLRIRGACTFKAPAAGGTINLQGALAGAGANVTILTNSQVKSQLY